MKVRTLRVISAIITLIMVLNVIPFSAFALESAESTQTMELSVSSDNGISGETVQVTVNLKNNPGLASLKFDVEYDGILALTDVALNSESFGLIETKKPYTNPQSITLLSPLADISAEGTLATLTFAVSEQASDGYVANVNITYNADDVYNGQFEKIALSVVNGSVTVHRGIPGDIDGDSKVDTKDAILLFRYIAGWNVNVDLAALDVNGDNKVDTKDAITLFRYIAGWEGIVICRGKVCAHTPVTDEAVAPTYDSTGLTEGSHCGTCGEVLVAQQIVPKLETSYHSITYRNLQGAESPEITQYAEHLGIAFEDVPEPVRSGYEFLGWFESSEESSKKVDEVKAGRTDDITVYAHWKPITYTITYKDAPVNNNPTTYTVEDEFVLADAGWSGRIFEFWADEAGAAISKISKGTTGNLTITAKWSSYKNRVVKKEDSKLLSMYDAESNKYYFVRELGMISNVVLDEIEETHNKTTDAPYTLRITESVSVSEGISNGIAEMVATSTTNSEEWQNVHTQTDTWNVKVSAGIETKMLKKLFKVNASGEFSGGTTTTDSETHVKYESKTEESSVETTSTLSYAKEMTATGETSINILSDMPYGKYTYVHAADVHVFAVVTYDAQEGCYYLDTYSEMDTPHNMLMYYATAYEDDVSCQALAYDIPIDEITGIIGSSYYVKYDANGGKGEMLCSMHKVGESSALQANQYTRPGYTFAGWGLKTDSEAAIYKDGANVKDIAEQGKSVTLYAIWIEKECTISYNANGGTGTMNDTVIMFTESHKLSENGFSRDRYLLWGWSTDPSATTPEYKYNTTITPLEIVNAHPDIVDDQITLYAVWTRAYVTYNLGDGTVTDNHDKCTTYNINIIDQTDDNGYSINLNAIKESCSSGKMLVDVWCNTKVINKGYKQVYVTQDSWHRWWSTADNRYHETDDYAVQYIQWGDSDFPTKMRVTFTAAPRQYVCVYFGAHGEDKDKWTYDHLWVTVRFE